MLHYVRRWWTTYVLLSTLLFITSCTIWLAILQPVPMYYDPIPFRVLTTTLPPGETLRIVVGRCVTRKLSYISAAVLLNLDTHEQTVLQSSVHAALSPGCTRTANDVYGVPPPGTTPGRYIMRGASIVQEPLRTYYIPWYTEEFRVSG